MAEAKTRPGKTARNEIPEPDPARSGSHACPVAFCPIGIALSAVQQAGPEVLEHLLAAARELMLATKAVVDARAADFDERKRPPTLERIEIA